MRSPIGEASLSPVIFTRVGVWACGYNVRKIRAVSIRHQPPSRICGILRVDPIDRLRGLRVMPAIQQICPAALLYL